METLMKKYIVDIQEKTSGMSKKEKYAYILTYYWYHILGISAIIALILLFTFHYCFGNKKPVFTCILVNQEMETSQAGEMAESFAECFNLPMEQVVITSDYLFSYGDVQLEGVNETSYEKFFLQWRNEEIDAVIIPESFYFYVKELGGEFKMLDEEAVEGVVPYMDENICTAIVLGNDSFTERISGKKDEKLLLAFPETGQHTEECEMFLEFLKNFNTEKGGTGVEENVD